MTRDDIIRMAREAGSIDSEEVIETVWRAFSAAEREACAAFLDRGVDLSDLAEHPAWQRYSADLLTACAAAIRARKP